MNNYPQQTSGNGRANSAGYYLLIGAGLGAAAGLLLAPKKGSETRHQIAETVRVPLDWANELVDKVGDGLKNLELASKQADIPQLDLNLPSEDADADRKPAANTRNSGGPSKGQARRSSTIV